MGRVRPTAQVRTRARACSGHPYAAPVAPASHHRPVLVDRTLGTLLIVWSSHALYGLISESSALNVTAIESPPIRYVWGLLYLLSLLRLATRARATLLAAACAWPAIALTAFAFASVFWSIEPDLSLRRSFAAAGTVIVILYFSVFFDLRSFVSLCFRSLILVAVLSVAVIVMAPDIGIHQDRLHPAWRGTFPHKNPFGRAMFLGMLCALTLAVGSGKPRQYLACAVGFLALTVLSHSAMSLMMAATAGFSVLFLAAIRRSTGAIEAVGLIVILMVAVSLPFGIFDEVGIALADVFGKDLTFTGRTRIWAVTWDSLTGDRLLLGFGHEAFWQGPGGAQDIFQRLGHYIPPHAHNGFLHITVAFGLPGLAVAGLMVITLLGNVKAYVRTQPYSEAHFAFAFVAAWLLLNVFEAQIFASNYLFWIVAMRVHVEAAQRRVSDQKHAASRTYGGIGRGRARVYSM